MCETAGVGSGVVLVLWVLAPWELGLGKCKIGMEGGRQ